MIKYMLLIATIVCIAASLTFGYAGYYCLNSGEPDLAEGLWLTFAIPAFVAGFVTLAIHAIIPERY